MDLITFAALYLGSTAVLLFVLLFGENPLFVNTPVGWFRWLITSGIWDALGWVVWKCCGDRGVAAVEDVMDYCCDRPNPALQMFYLALFSGGFYAYNRFVFTLLPGTPFVSEDHMWSGTALTCLCLILFVWASASDPGTITEANVAKHRALYAADGYLWQEVNCWTCTFVRPARSKHCRVCGRCVARFDHHCAWINNCVGLNNTRLFFSFLLANCALCLYGSTLAAMVLYGELHKHNILKMSVWDPKLERLVQMTERPRVVAQWLLHYYPAPCLLLLFLLVATLLLVAFFSYHFYLLIRGVTMYETFRQQKREQEHAQAAPSPAPLERRPKTCWSKVWGSVFRHGGSSRLGACTTVANPYDRGIVSNLYEVMRPNAVLDAAWAAAQKEGKEE